MYPTSADRRREEAHAADNAAAETPPPARSPAPLAVRALLGLALVYTLYFARPLLFPITVSILLTLLLRGPVGWLKRIRIPKPLGAALVLAVLLGGASFAVWELRAPATSWLERAPSNLKKLERKLEGLKKPMQKVTQAAEKVEQLATGGAPATPSTRQVKVDEPSAFKAAVASLPDVLLGLGVILVLVYLLLVFDEQLLGKLIDVLPRLADRRRAVVIASHVEAQVSRYLQTVAAINLCLGLAVGLAMRLIGLPNPWLWGAMAGIVNFVPYLGATVGVAIVAAVALLSLTPLSHALLAPAAYAAINSLEGMVISPFIFGRRLALDPVVIFVWLFAWGWIWGIGGALIAVPLLTALKIVCDHVPSLSWLAQLLGDAPPARTEDAASPAAPDLASEER